MINKERMQLFIDALRSGEFSQAYGALRGCINGGLDRDDHVYGYCCLGVAMVVARRNGCETDLDYWLSEESELSEQVRQWYGLESTNPTIESHAFIRAIEANDTYRWTFSQIADAFEDTYMRVDAA